MGKLIPDPDNVPLNDKTRGALGRFISMKPIDKIEIYQESIKYLQEAIATLEKAESLIPASSYHMHYAKQNARDRIRELEYLITTQEKNAVADTVWQEELRANMAAARGEKV